MNEIEMQDKVIPVIALRGIVPFPDTNINLDIGREISIKALNIVENSDDRLVLLLPQKSFAVANPVTEDLNKFGVIAEVKSIIKMAPDNHKVLVVNHYRAKAIELQLGENGFFAKYARIDDSPIEEVKAQAILRLLKAAMAKYALFDKKLPNEVVTNIMSENSLVKMLNLMATTILKMDEDKIEVLNIVDTEMRANHLLNLIERELEIMKVEASISKRVRESVDKSQKEYYLREQMKAISEELGDDVNECDEYRKKAKKLKIKDKDILQKVEKEIVRLSKTPPNSPDSAVIRTYLDWICELPWNNATKDNEDIAKCRDILDEDHYGLEKVKERILEFISVHTLTKSMKGSILCLVGPPGVGKTSIAKSIARSVNKNYVRMSLGGVRDEAEIRGHRRTYVGAMPGRIIYNMRNSKSINPLFLLDEIDKMASDFRGDPASAMLEVLDPEQNNSFRDHFLEVPYDLSKVFFVTTANSLDTIPEPLLDRMEVIEISGYTEEEKIQIAKKYLIPKKATENGLDKADITLTDRAISDIINFYTRESGVRNLERGISNVFRKIALKVSLDKSYLEKPMIIDTNIEEILGARHFTKDDDTKKDEVGACRGLAWTSVGGTTLTIEVALMSGKGDIILTGKLGDVMKESARTALSYIHSKASEYGIDEDIFSNKDLHIHVPEGATPKDGPSAGITMATAILSCLTNKKVRSDVAMTGEITLRGKVLPIGGLKEKALAAYRIGIKNIIIPMQNKKDLEEIPKEVREQMHFVPVENASEVFNEAILEL